MNLLRTGVLLSTATVALPVCAQGTGLRIYDMPGQQRINDIELALNGDLYLAGMLSSGATERALVIRCDPSGALIGARSYLMTGQNTEATGISQRPDGGFWLGGNFYTGGTDASTYLLSLDAALDTLACHAVTPATWGGGAHFVMSTPTGDAITGGRQGWIMGSFGWITTQGPMNSSSSWFAPGTGIPGQMDYSQLLDGAMGSDGYAIVGYGPEGLNGSTLMLRYNSSGSLMYTTAFTAAAPGLWGEAIAAGPSGTAVAGCSAGSHAFIVVKTDSAGAILWSRHLTIPADDHAQTIQLRNDGRIVLLTRQYGTSMHLTQFSPNGTWEWTRSYTAPGMDLDGTDLVVLPNEGGYAIAGTALLGGAEKPFLMLTDTAGLTGNCDGPQLIASSQPITLIASSWGPLPISRFPFHPTVTDTTMSATDQVVCGNIATRTAPEVPGLVTITIAPDPFQVSTRIIADRMLTPDHSFGLIDPIGRTVRSFAGNGTRELRLERGDLAAGIYTLRLTQAGRWLGAVRLVVE